MKTKEKVKSVKVTASNEAPVLSETTASDTPSDTPDVKTIGKLDVSFPSVDLNKLVEKLNEVIEKING